VDLALLGRLQSVEGALLLDEVDSAYDGNNALAVSEQLRTHHDGALVTAALTQVSLRRRAAAKFGDEARRLFFTPDGLEQATTSVVAERRADRLVAAGVGRLLELGCGIGADLVALARAGIAMKAVEQDALTAAVARANLAALGLSGTVTVGDATQHDRAGFQAVFADPARRSSSGRVFDPDSYRPPWNFVARLLDETAVVKVAPGFPHELVPAGVEAEWVSLDGHLREAALWSGLLAQQARRATVLTSSGDAHVLTEEDDPGPAGVQPVGRFVYEPDDAVIRAHLVTAVAAATEGWLLDPHLAYVSSDARHELPYARCFAVREVLPYREKQLRAALRARDIGPVTIKKRGIDVAPEVLRARLGLHGSQPATLILTRTPGSAAALLVDPLP
jgi:SAM-dependent methyltransferase